MAVKEIHRIMPRLRDVVGHLADHYPDDYRWPQSVVNREATFAVKEHMKMPLLGPMPDGEFLVTLAGYGKVRIRNGKVVGHG